MCQDCENGHQKPNQNNEKQCEKCGLYFNSKATLCQRCQQVDNYVRYLAETGGLI